MSTSETITNWSKLKYKSNLDKNLVFQFTTIFFGNCIDFFKRHFESNEVKIELLLKHRQHKITLDPPVNRKKLYSSSLFCCWEEWTWFQQIQYRGIPFRFLSIFIFEMEKNMHISIARHLDLFAWKRSIFFLLTKHNSLLCVSLGKNRSSMYYWHSILSQCIETHDKCDTSKREWWHTLCSFDSWKKLPQQQKSVALILLMWWIQFFFCTGKRTHTR